MSKGTVYLVDDEPVLLEALAEVLVFEGFCVKVFESASHYLRFLEAASSDFLEPRCVICDVNMPQMNGLEMQKMVGHHVDIPIILMSGLKRADHVVDAFRQGALHFLIKPVSSETLVNAVNEGLVRSTEIMQHKQTMTDWQSKKNRLTKRESEIMTLVVKGLRSHQISDVLGITLRTVKMHRQNAMTKLEIKNVVELVNFAEE